MIRILLSFFLLVICFSISAGENPVTIFYNDHDVAIEIAQSENKPLLIVFSADWCAYCDKLKSEIIADNHANNFVICIIDYDTNKTLVRKYKVKSLPTSIILKNKTEVNRKIGYKNKQDYINWLNDD